MRAAGSARHLLVFELVISIDDAHRVSCGPRFRGFTISLVVSQPATVDGLVDAALQAGATTLKPVAKSLWGYGGVVYAPDGTIWKVATSSKKNTGPATRRVDDVVLLLGASDVGASKRFYVRLAVRADGGSFVDPDHFGWEASAMSRASEV